MKLQQKWRKIKEKINTLKMILTLKVIILLLNFSLQVLKICNGQSWRIFSWRIVQKESHLNMEKIIEKALSSMSKGYRFIILFSEKL